MLILLTNDDGIFAPGLAAMQRRLQRLGEVYVVAPATEKSGVGHSITYLTPLIVKEVYHGRERWGWAVEGNPADCVKIGVTELCPREPDLIVSGINGGLNAGINVLYSGTVAAAIEGAFFGITSVAVSLEFDEHAEFDRAAILGCQVIEQIVEKSESRGQLFNLNIPTSAVAEPLSENTASGKPPIVETVSMNTTRYDDKYERRTDPWGRDYYWATGRPLAASGDETDIAALARGNLALSTLKFDMTDRAALGNMGAWGIGLDTAELAELEDSEGGRDDSGHASPVVRSMRRMQSITPQDE